MAGEAGVRFVAQGDADLAGKLAVQVRNEVEDWIRRNHADKMA
jgi:hypothetical protein